MHAGYGLFLADQRDFQNILIKFNSCMLFIHEI